MSTDEIDDEIVRIGDLITKIRDKISTEEIDDEIAVRIGDLITKIRDNGVDRQIGNFNAVSDRAKAASGVYKDILLRALKHSSMGGAELSESLVSSCHYHIEKFPIYTRERKYGSLYRSNLNLDMIPDTSKNDTIASTSIEEDDIDDDDDDNTEDNGDTKDTKDTLKKKSLV